LCFLCSVPFPNPRTKKFAEKTRTDNLVTQRQEDTKEDRQSVVCAGLPLCLRVFVSLCFRPTATARCNRSRPHPGNPLRHKHMVGSRPRNRTSALEGLRQRLGPTSPPQ